MRKFHLPSHQISITSNSFQILFRIVFVHTYKSSIGMDVKLNRCILLITFLVVKIQNVFKQPQLIDSELNKKNEEKKHDNNKTARRS